MAQNQKKQENRTLLKFYLLGVFFFKFNSIGGLFSYFFWFWPFNDLKLPLNLRHCFFGTPCISYEQFLFPLKFHSLAHFICYHRDYITYLVDWMSVTRELDHRGYRCLPGGCRSCGKSWSNIWFLKFRENIELFIYLAKFVENRCHCWKYVRGKYLCFIPLNNYLKFSIIPLQKISAIWIWKDFQYFINCWIFLCIVRINR